MNALDLNAEPLAEDETQVRNAWSSKGQEHLGEQQEVQPQQEDEPQRRSACGSEADECQGLREQADQTPPEDVPRNIHANRWEADETRRILREQAIEILGTADLGPLSNFIANLWKLDQENQELHITAVTLSNFMAKSYPNALTLKLCQAFESPQQDGDLRARSISLLHGLLNHCDVDSDNYSINLSSLWPEIISELKRVLVSYLQRDLPKNVLKNVCKTISLVAQEILLGKNGEWDELRDVISLFFRSDLKKGYLIFKEMPYLISDQCFLVPVIDGMYILVLKRLVSENETEDWVEAFASALVLGIQVADSSRKEMMKAIIRAMSESISRLLSGGKEELVRRGFEELAELVEERAQGYRKAETLFVSDLVKSISGVDGMADDTFLALQRVSSFLDEYWLSEESENWTEWLAEHSEEQQIDENKKISGY